MQVTEKNKEIQSFSDGWEWPSTLRTDILAQVSDRSFFFFTINWDGRTFTASHLSKQAVCCGHMFNTGYAVRINQLEDLRRDANKALDYNSFSLPSYLRLPAPHPTSHRRTHWCPPRSELALHSECYLSRTLSAAMAPRGQWCPCKLSNHQASGLVPPYPTVVTGDDNRNLALRPTEPQQSMSARNLMRSEN